MAEMKAHIALTVSNLERSRAFYKALLDVSPNKVRPGYVKFDVLQPSLVLTLIEGNANGGPGAFNHGGIRVDSTDDVLAASLRLRKLGLDTLAEHDTQCCYARQDKVWVTDPDGLRWEVFTVREDVERGEHRPSGDITAAPACC